MSGTINGYPPQQAVPQQQQFLSGPAWPNGTGAQALLGQRPLMSLLPGQSPGTQGVIQPGGQPGQGMVAMPGQPQMPVAQPRSAYLPPRPLLNGQSLYSDPPNPGAQTQQQLTQMQQLLARLRADQGKPPESGINPSQLPTSPSYSA